MDADKPCRCPRCGWLGTIHDAEAYQPLAHLEPLNICPRCATETEVQPLGQKGLDALYREYALLLKPGYQPQGDRAERAPSSNGSSSTSTTRRAPRQAPISSRHSRSSTRATKKRDRAF